MIDEQHHFGALARALVAYESSRRVLTLLPPDEIVLRDPSSLGFVVSHNPHPASTADWVQSSFITRVGYRVNIHVCRIEDRWCGYYTLEPQADVWTQKPNRHHEWPELESVYLIRKLAGLVNADGGIQLWEEESRGTGRFTGRAVVIRPTSEHVGDSHYHDESIRLARIVVNADCSFRIQWYADAVAPMLRDAYSKGALYRIQGVPSRGSDPLKDRMALRQVPEDVAIRVTNDSVIAKGVSLREWMDS